MFVKIISVILCWSNHIEWSRLEYIIFNRQNIIPGGTASVWRQRKQLYRSRMLKPEALPGLIWKLNKRLKWKRVKEQWQSNSLQDRNFETQPLFPSNKSRLLQSDPSVLLHFYLTETKF